MDRETAKRRWKQRVKRMERVIDGFEHSVNDSMEVLKRKCTRCGEEKPSYEVDMISVESKSCAITHAVSVGRTYVNVCFDCLKRGFYPESKYVSSLKWYKFEEDLEEMEV